MRIPIRMLIIALVVPWSSAVFALDKPTLLILPMDFVDSNQPPRVRLADALQGCLGGDAVRQRVALTESDKQQALPKATDDILSAAKKGKADYVLSTKFQISDNTLMASGDLINVYSGETVGHIQNAGVIEDFVTFQSKLLYQLRDLLPEYVDTTPKNNRSVVTLSPSDQPVHRDPKVVAAERAAAEAAAASRDPLALDATPFIRAATSSEIYYVVSPDNPNYLYMEGRNFRGFITVTNNHRDQLQRQGSISSNPLPRSVLTMPPVGAGAPPMNAAGRTPIGAAGRTPIGAAGQTPLGAAGQTPIGAAGQTPIGAAGQTPIGAAGSYTTPNTSNSGGFVQPGLNLPNRSQFGPRGFTTETPQGSTGSPAAAPATPGR